MKTNVMIFGGGYPAVQIYFSLKHSLRFHPILAGSYDNHSSYISRDSIIDLPYTYETDFVEKLNQCLEEREIKFIMPVHDTAALTLMEHEKEIQAVIVCSPLETTRLCRYKSMTYKALDGCDFIPEIYTYDDAVYPLFAKDDEGQGGRNSYKINDVKELERLKDDGINYVLCEYLPGREVTIDCFTDRHGELRFAQPRYRDRIMNGISARTSNADMTDEIKHIVYSISSRIRFRGFWFIQCKEDAHGRLKLMEISTRFSGTFGLSKNMDVNLPLLALCDFSDMEIDIKPNACGISLDKTYIDRYKIDYPYERVYIDFDDTLVFDRRRYNTEAMRFVYQCLNKGIKLVLITKHEYDLHETMKSIRLSEEIFDDIIEVPQDEPKSKYIKTDVPAIFIDNAYVERRRVKEELGIPTYDVSNIECLIDWADN